MENILNIETYFIEYMIDNLNIFKELSLKNDKKYLDNRDEYLEEIENIFKQADEIMQCFQAIEENMRSHRNK